MAQTEPINLGTKCGPMPSGADLAGYDGYSGNLILTVEGVLSWHGPMRWGVRVEKPTITKSGRKGKPERVLMLIANDGETVPDLLRQIATLWDMGEVEIGKNYPLPESEGVTADDE